VLPFICGWRPWRAGRPALKMPRDEELRAAAVPRIRAAIAANLPAVLRAVAVTAIVVALSRPQAALPASVSRQPGTAVVLALDLSTSMRAQDLGTAASRLEVAQDLLGKALQGRSALVGLVAFAGESVVRLPLTGDTALVQKVLEGLDAGSLRDGTDLAGSMLMGSQMLSGVPQPSRVLLLVTDGAHNQPGTDPAMAARFAQARGVRIDAVALAGEGLSSTDASAMETVLMQATRLTGGRYFRASDVDSVDRLAAALEAPRNGAAILVAEGPPDWRSLVSWCVMLAVVLLAAELLIRGSRWGVYP